MAARSLPMYEASDGDPFFFARAGASFSLEDV